MLCLFCGNLEAAGVFKPHHPCQLSDGGPCAACKEVQELEPQIAEARDILNKMLVRHRELRTKMNHSHNPIICQLPMEIASHIFELSIPERPPGRSSRGLTKNEICAPLILGAVCRAWRQIAFSTPQIWMSISIYLGNRHNSAKAGPTQCKLAQEWLSRSGDLPLSLYIHGDENTGGANIRPLMEIINRRSSRWSHLELELPVYFASLLCGDSSSASILRHLQLYLNDKSEDKVLDSFTLNNVKPSPTSISLEHWLLNKVDIEWNHATHVNLRQLDISECIEVLRCAPQLICFKITDALYRSFSNFRPYATPATPIFRPRLRELEISVDKADMYAKFVDSFILAGLETLTYECWRERDLLPTNSLISQINRSSCLLTTLSIEKYSITNDEILPLLLATPSLRNLHFWGLSDISQFNAMTFLSSNKAEEDGHILPGLETISFSCIYSNEVVEELFPWSLVLKMFGPVSDLHSPHRRPLSKFNISVTQNWQRELKPSQYIDKESIHRFLELKEAGITLDFMILNYTEERDFIKLSIEHHGRIDKPSPFCDLPS